MIWSLCAPMSDWIWNRNEEIIPVYRLTQTVWIAPPTKDIIARTGANSRNRSRNLILPALCAVMPEKQVADRHGSSECRRSGYHNDVFSWSFKYVTESWSVPCCGAVFGWVWLYACVSVMLCLGECDHMLVWVWPCLGECDGMLVWVWRRCLGVTICLCECDAVWVNVTVCLCECDAVWVSVTICLCVTLFGYDAVCVCVCVWVSVTHLILFVDCSPWSCKH